MKFVLPCVFILITFLSVSINAQGRFLSLMTPIQTKQQANQQLRIKSSKQAAQMVKARFTGKVLKVQKHNSGYRVKLIKADGHIVSVSVNAKTGRMSGGY